MPTPNQPTPAHRKMVQRAFETLANDTIPRRKLAAAVQKVVNRFDLTRAETALQVKDAASQMSRLLTGHVGEFSADRLAGYLVALGADVDITIKLPTKRTKKRGKVRVTSYFAAPAATDTQVPVSTSTE
jgi:predicted XRE-type DNA-binding protein